MKHKRFIPSQRIKGSDKEVFIVNFEGSVLEFQRTSNLYEPLIIRMDGELLETVPSKQNKEIEFSIADGKHKIQVWNERVANTLVPKIFVKDGIAIVIDGIPVQNSLADPITRLNSSKAIIWLLTILLFVKGFIIPLTFLQEFKETQHLIILFIYIILFILSLSAALTFQLNPLRSTWLALVICIIESAEFFYSIAITRDLTILTILFAALRLGIIGSLIFSLRNLKHILNYDQDTIPLSKPTYIQQEKIIEKRFSFPLKYAVIIIVSLIIVAGIYYVISEFITNSRTPSIERDSSLGFRTDLKLPDLIPYRKGDKWGYCDRNKNIVIPPKYKSVEFVRNEKSHLIVNLNGLYGVIDITGRKVIPFVYDELLDYPEQSLFVAKRGNSGIIDYKNNTLFPFEYNHLSVYDDYIIASKIFNGVSKESILSFSGEIILDYKYGDLQPIYNNKDLFITSIERRSYFDYDLTYSHLDNYYGILNKFGEIILPFEYRLLLQGFKPFIVAHKGNVFDAYNYYRNVGLIDNRGKFLIQCQYDDIDYDYYSDNVGLESIDKYFKVMNDNKWGVVNIQNEIIIPITYEYIRILKRNDSFYFRVDLNNKSGLLNEFGEVIIPFDYMGLGLDRSNQYVSASFQGKCGVINFENEIVIPLEYDNWIEYSEGLAAVKITDEEKKIEILQSTNKVDSFFVMKLFYGLTQGDPDGTILEEPGYRTNYYNQREKLLTPELRRKFYKYHKQFLPGFNNSEDFEMTAVSGLGWWNSLPGKWGYFDENGELKIDFIYDAAEKFENGFAKVMYDNKWGIINQKNQVVVPLKYDEIYSRDNFDLFEVEIDGKEGYIDINRIEYFLD